MHTEEFFEFLYPNIANSGDVIELRPIFVDECIPDFTRRIQSNSIKVITDAAKEANDTGDHHVFFECAALKAYAKDGTERSIRCFPFLYADVDQKLKDMSGRIIKKLTKKELFKNINQFVIPPSIVVDSGNGYHCYWALSSPIYRIDHARYLLSVLNERIGGDFRAKLTTQLLRVPNTYNRKSKSKLLCRIVMFNNIRYSVQDIVKALDVDLNNMPDDVRTICDYEYRPSAGTIKFLFDKRPQPMNIKINDYDEVIAILKKQNMLLASNLPKHPIGHAFRCCFHNDQNPSANVFRTKNGHYMYHCFACGAIYDIITIYQKCTGKSYLCAIDDLCAYFGIAYSMNEWTKAQVMKYFYNAQWFGQLEKLQHPEQFPNLFKLIGSKMHYLRMLNAYAQEKPITPALMHEGDSVFFASYEYLAAFGHSCSFGSKTTAYRAISLFSALGLISKVPVDEIPIEGQSRAKMQTSITADRVSLVKRAHTEPVNFYKLPLFQDVLIEAERRATQLINAKYKHRYASKETFIHTLGQNIADETYHDERTISKRNETLAKYLFKTLENLIFTTGYATKALIATKTKLPGRLSASREDKDKEVDRRLSNWLTTLNCEYRRIKKAEMHKFKQSRPIFIIVPKQKVS